MTAASRSLPVLQELLAREHAAVWAVGVVGAHLDGAVLDLARQFDAAHRARRDLLEARIRALGGVPVAALPAYQLPFPVDAAPAAARLGALIEDDLAAANHDALARTDDSGLRRLAVEGLREAATRAATWRLAVGASPVTLALPGAP